MISWEYRGGVALLFKTSMISLAELRLYVSVFCLSGFREEVSKLSFSSKDTELGRYIIVSSIPIQGIVDSLVVEVLLEKHQLQ